MFTDKLTLAIAEAAKKCMDEELVGNQHKIDANKNGKVDAHDFKLLRKEEQMSNPGLESLASRLKATRTGKPSNPALEKLAHEKAKAKYLNKEETVNEEEGQNGYVAFSHDGRKADIHANSSYEAHRKAIKHFDAPKAKHHMVVVKLAQKGGKDVVHTATESVQEAAIDDLRDRQAAKREANPYVPTAKKEDPAKRVVQGNQYGGAKQKDEKEVDESVDMGQADRTLRQKEKSKNTYHVKDSSGKIISTHDNHSDAMRDALKHDDHKVVKEAVESTNQHYVVAHNRARGVSSIVKKDGEHHLHPSKEAASEHAGKLNAKSSSPHVYYTYGGNINEDMEDLNESKAHIEQHLADRDINSKVTGKVVKVHSSDVSSTKKHIQKAGYKDHTVVGGLNEEKMSDEDMDQREKIVKGMKKNLQGFKARYGDRAKDVMYATATKQAMKEGAVPSTEKTVKVKHATSGKEIVVTAKSADKYKAQGYHPVKEETEQLDEASIKLFMGMYQVWHKGKKIASYNSKTDAQDHANSLKEEVEQIDELSKGTLGRYVKRASRDGAHKSALAQVYSQNFDKSIDMNRIAIKRKKGIDKAVDKLTKEEVDSDTFNSELADNKAKAAGTKKQPDIAKASVQAVKQESFSEILSMIKEGVRSYLKDRNNG